MSAAVRKFVAPWPIDILFFPHLSLESRVFGSLPGSLLGGRIGGFPLVLSN